MCVFDKRFFRLSVSIHDYGSTRPENNKRGDTGFERRENGKEKGGGDLARTRGSCRESGRMASGKAWRIRGGIIERTAMKSSFAFDH